MITTASMLSHVRRQSGETNPLQAASLKGEMQQRMMRAGTMDRWANLFGHCATTCDKIGVILDREPYGAAI
jgi:hypothetical protein